ncbi:MAG TPA: hypothetical protein VEC18_11445, partial [Myxococcota bacterium]|nr:hypothetical protein [Myxococcota bacterium]
RESRWTLSEDGARIEIGSSVFDQTGAVHRLAYDSTKRGIRVEVEYAPRGPVAWAERESPGEYPIDLLELVTPARARIWLAGMPEPAASEGTIALAHTYLGASEADLALRRIDFASIDAGPAIFLSDRTAPSGARERWLVVARAGEVLHQTSDFELEISQSPGKESGDYPTFEELRIRGARVEGAILRGATLAELNPLDDIPQPFRFLLSLRTRPQRAWSTASFEIRLRPEPPMRLSEADESETVVTGSGITSVTYTNPLPPKMTSGPETATPGA